MIADAFNFALRLRPIQALHILVQINLLHDILIHIDHIEPVQIEQIVPEIARQAEQKALQHQNKHHPLVIVDSPLRQNVPSVHRLLHNERSVHPTP